MACRWMELIGLMRLTELRGLSTRTTRLMIGLTMSPKSGLAERSSSESPDYPTSASQVQQGHFSSSHSLLFHSYSHTPTFPDANPNPNPNPTILATKSTLPPAVTRVPTLVLKTICTTPPVNYSLSLSLSLSLTLTLVLLLLRTPTPTWTWYPRLRLRVRRLKYYNNTTERL
ncbi:hypothetical protein EJ08DRAFT_35806 [Tothia fuscella]|uniref:Uncharacterized protein n=1 Tax=Tothia fuscella TaxID=1048955 RepID=A0A9P4TT74_9PEZI|nr:hypothetical protein EJ08DRAFT_35806 [Tothia fuscella]